MTAERSRRPVSACGRSNRVESIQWLRGIAAMLVVCNHAGSLALNQLAAPETSLGGVAWKLAGIGGFGVDIFFVISGFVMALSAKRFDGGAGAVQFLAQRFNRIAPLFYLLSVILLADLIHAGASFSPLRIVNTLTFVPWLDGVEYHWPLHFLGWTLAFEFVFYLVVAALITGGRGGASLLLAAILFVLVAIGFAVSLPWMPWRMLTSPMMIEFAFGVLLYAAFVNDRFDRSPRLWRVLAIAGVALLIWPFLSGTDVIIEVGTRQFEQDGAVQRLLWWGIPAGLIVAGTLTLTASGQGKCQGRSRRWALAIGDATYSIYLTHLFVVRLGEEIIKRGEVSPIVVAVGVVLVSPLVGIACYRLVELPMMRCGQRAITRWFGKDAPGRHTVNTARLTRTANGQRAANSGNGGPEHATLQRR